MCKGALHSRFQWTDDFFSKIIDGIFAALYKFHWKEYLHVEVMEDLAHPLCSLYPLIVTTDLTFEIFLIFLKVEVFEILMV